MVKNWKIENYVRLYSKRSLVIKIWLADQNLSEIVFRGSQFGQNIKMQFQVRQIKKFVFFSLQGWLISLCHFSRWKSSFIYNYRGLMTHSPIDSFAKWLIVSHPWVILFREKINSMWFPSRSHPSKNISRKWSYRN